MSKNDKMINYSVFANAKDGVPKARSSTWEEFVAGLGPHRFDIDDKKRCSMFGPFETRAGATIRAAKNVLRVTIGVMDIDEATSAQVGRLREKLEGFDAVLYTTWRHVEAHQSSLTDPNPDRRGIWKFRVCVRLSRPVEIAEWPAFWPAFMMFFDNLNDPACKDACHCYFGAFAPPGTPPELCHFIVYKGEPLDVNQIMEMAAAWPPPGHQKVSRDL